MESGFHACVFVCVSLPHAQAILTCLSQLNVYPTNGNGALFINTMNIDFFIGGGRKTNIEHPTPTTIQSTIHKDYVVEHILTFSQQIYADKWQRNK